MTDTAPDAKSSTLTAAPKDSSAQMIVALATVLIMGVIALASLAVAALCSKETAIVVAAFAVPTTVAGALANSLASPSGIASVISSARKAGQP